MQELHRILDQYVPRPELVDQLGGLNFAMVSNEQDRQYLKALAQMLKSFDRGNPNLNIGFNLLDGQYHLWLLNFRGEYNESHFKLLAGVQHPVANWTPLRKDSVGIRGIPNFGTGIRVRVDPMPMNTLTLPITQAPAEIQSQQQLLMHNPLPTHAIVPVQQQQQPGPIILHEEIRHHHQRDESPKREDHKKNGKKAAKKAKDHNHHRPTSRANGRRGRTKQQPTGLFAGLAQAFVGPPTPPDSSSESSD